MSVMVEIYGDRVEISNPGEPIVPVERFIDGYQSRNERLADLMRRFSICEEKSSGIDKVVQAVETYQLPAPDFHTAFRRTAVTLFGHQPFEDMDRSTRVRACYQHCCLRYVLHQKMTNQTLRRRFNLPEAKTALVSQTISATVEAGMIKLSDPDKTSTSTPSRLKLWMLTPRNSRFFTEFVHKFSVDRVLGTGAMSQYGHDILFKRKAFEVD